MHSDEYLAREPYGNRPNSPRAARKALALACQYTGRVCTNPRAVKLDGRLHKLCQYHRQRANRNQRRSQTRHRQQAKQRDLLAESLQSTPQSEAPGTPPFPTPLRAPPELVSTGQWIMNAFNDMLPTDIEPIPFDTIATNASSLWTRLTTLSKSAETFFIEIFKSATPPQPRISIENDWVDVSRDLTAMQLDDPSPSDEQGGWVDLGGVESLRDEQPCGGIHIPPTTIEPVVPVPDDIVRAMESTQKAVVAEQDDGWTELLDGYEADPELLFVLETSSCDGEHNR